MVAENIHIYPATFSAQKTGERQKSCVFELKSVAT